MRSRANTRTAALAWSVPLLVLAGVLFPVFDQPAGANGNRWFCQAYTALAKSHLSGTSQSTLRLAAADFEKLAIASPRLVKKYAQLLAQDELKVANGKAATVNNAKAEAASNSLDAFAQRACQ